MNRKNGIKRDRKNTKQTEEREASLRGRHVVTSETRRVIKYREGERTSLREKRDREREREKGRERR